MNNKVYVVVEDWGADCEYGTQLHVFSNIEKAKICFKECVKTIKENYINDDYIIEESEQSFSAYEDGNYRYAHNDVYIGEEEVL